MNTTQKYLLSMLLLLTYTSVQHAYVFEDLAEDVVYTPVVTADKVVHPVQSVSEPIKTTADIIPIPTYEDYRSDYDYRSVDSVDNDTAYDDTEEELS